MRANYGSNHNDLHGGHPVQISQQNQGVMHNHPNGQPSGGLMGDPDPEFFTDQQMPEMGDQRIQGFVHSSPMGPQGQFVRTANGVPMEQHFTPYQL